MKIIKNYPLSIHSSIKIGGSADLALFPENEEEFIGALEGAALVVGGGSNILFPDSVVRGAVLFTDKLDNLTFDGNTLECGAGVRLPFLAREAVKRGLAGLECLSGIPGSVGGAIFMNAGAYGQEIGEVVRFVRTNKRSYTKDECAFSYRGSVFQEGGEYILSVTLALSAGETQILNIKMSECREKRKASQPSEPSAGSVWKRGKNAEIIPARLIDEAGLKGLRVGGAMISPKHAGFIINTGNATGADVIELIETVEKRIFELHGIILEREIIIVKEGL